MNIETATKQPILMSEGAKKPCMGLPAGNISRAARIAIHNFSKGLKLPFRYLGAKTWSVPGLMVRLPGSLIARAVRAKPWNTLHRELFGTGYRYSAQKTLSGTELQKYLSACCANAATQINKPEYLAPLGWQELKAQRFFDPETGLKISVYRKNQHLIVAFGALRAHEVEMPHSKEASSKLKKQGIRNAILNLAGGTPAIYQQANRWVENFLREKNPEEEITLSGQCYGGSFASYAALKNNLGAVCINPLPLGAGLQQEIGNQKLSEADKWITHISVKNDYISDNKGIEILNRALSAIGIRTPGNFGRKFSIPSAYKTMKNTHWYALDSFMQHLGFDKKARPGALRDRIKTTCTLSEERDASDAVQNDEGIVKAPIPEEFCAADGASQPSESVQFISIRSLTGTFTHDFKY